MGHISCFFLLASLGLSCLPFLPVERLDKCTLYPELSVYNIIPLLGANVNYFQRQAPLKRAASFKLGGDYGAALPSARSAGHMLLRRSGRARRPQTKRQAQTQRARRAGAEWHQTRRGLYYEWPSAPPTAAETARSTSPAGSSAAAQRAAERADGGRSESRSIMPRCSWSEE